MSLNILVNLKQSISFLRALCLFFNLTNAIDHMYFIFQCCRAGAGGAEIILGPGTGAENKF